MTVLILAGTGEGRGFATFCAQNGIAATASLAGATRTPAPLDIPTCRGGFGSAQGFADYLKQQKIIAILDATHPFAARISQRSYNVACEMGLPYLQYLRPAWRAQQGDNWAMVQGMADVAPQIKSEHTVFLATGRQSLPHFADIECKMLYCRQIDPPEHDFPFENGAFVIGRPPFSVADEVALFKKLGVDVSVVKNAGGAFSRSKLDAARELGVKVIMINRPPSCGAPQVTQVAQVQDWLLGHKDEDH